jgi:glycosyltransferase involved in cell wall biosynthesis
MKILVISNPSSFDGAQASLRIATSHWKKLGWEIDLFIPPGPQGEIQPTLPLFKEAGMDRIDNIITGTPYKLVLINGLPNMAAIDSISGVKVAIWVHEAYEILWGSAARIGDWMRYFYKAHRVIFTTPYQSEVVFKSFIQDLPPTKIAYSSLSIPVIELNKSILKDPSNFRIAQVGSIIPRKRPDLLAKAAVDLQTEFPLSVDFIGDLHDSWAYNEDFKNFIKNSPEFIHWRGKITLEQKQDVLSSADVFVLASDSESFGLSPLEAASIDLPVILADLPAYHQVGWKHQDNCLFFPKGDLDGLKQCLTRVRNTPSIRKKMISGGRKLVKQYSTQKFLENSTAVVVNAIET